MRSPEQIEQFVVACLAGIKRDLYCFGALHITGDHRGYAWRALKNRLRAPKTTSGKIGYVCLAAVRLGTKCHAKAKVQICGQGKEEELGLPLNKYERGAFPNTPQFFGN